MDNSHYGQLHIFLAIAQAGSISAAARKLGIATPSASQALKLLEEKLGTPLFLRSTRHIQLTDAGKQLLMRTLPAMETLNHAIDEIKHNEAEPQGVVRITLSRFAYQLIFKPILSQFHQKFPKIQLDLSLNDGLANLIEDGFDLGIRFGDRVDEGMVARKLLDSFKEGLYISQAYADQFGTPKTIKQLENHQIIGYRFITSNRIEPLEVSINGENTALEIATPLMCNDTEIILDATRQGLGIGRIFEPNIQALPDRDQFIPILQKHWRSYPPVYLYYQHHRTRPQRVQVVIDFLLEVTQKKKNSIR